MIENWNSIDSEHNNNENNDLPLTVRHLTIVVISLPIILTSFIDVNLFSLFFFVSF